MAARKPSAAKKPAPRRRAKQPTPEIQVDRTTPSSPVEETKLPETTDLTPDPEVTDELEKIDADRSLAPYQPMHSPLKASGVDHRATEERRQAELAREREEHNVRTNGVGIVVGFNFKKDA